MSDIRYQINLGNCREDVNNSIIDLTVTPVTWDMTTVYFDSKETTFDQE